MARLARSQTLPTRSGRRSRGSASRLLRQAFDAAGLRSPRTGSPGDTSATGSWRHLGPSGDGERRSVLSLGAAPSRNLWTEHDIRGGSSRGPRASDLEQRMDNPEWKTVVLDAATGRPAV